MLQPEDEEEGWRESRGEADDGSTRRGPADEPGPSEVHQEESGRLLAAASDDEADAGQASSFRLPRFLPYVLVMLAGATYLCLRTPLRPPPATRPPPPASRQSGNMAMAKVRRRPPPLLPLSLSSRHPVYGVSVSEATRQLYGWDLIVEAGTDAQLAVDNPLPGMLYRWRLETAEGEVFFQGNGTAAAGDDTGVAVVVVRCPKAGIAVDVQVDEFKPNADGSVSAGRSYHTSNAVCKYVRREIRSLTEQDRNSYLDALNEFYRVPLEEGQARYGPDFVNAAWITACHNSRRWCLHQPSPFLVAHAAFVYWGEQEMRLIDPSVLTVPYWDHMIDTVTLGERWASSPIFSDDWFGSVQTTAQTNYSATRGRFGLMPVARDLGSVYERFRPGVDPWGHLTLGFTLNGQDYVTRTDEVCGIKSPIAWSPPENLFRCYELNRGWEQANQCMYDVVHNQLHSHMCGTWGCAVDLGQVYEQQPSPPVYSRELLAYIGVAGKQIWHGGSASAEDKGLSAFRHCEPPRWSNCTCELDVDGLALAELEDLMEPDLDTAMQAYPGMLYIRRRRSDGRYVFMSQPGQDLDADSNGRLMRMAAKIWCQGAVDGHMAGMASINDPIFYTSHAFFDRIFHFVLTSPDLNHTLNTTWGTNVKHKHCKGTAQSDRSPFSHFFLDTESGLGYTIHEMGEMLHPRQVALPYVYDDIVMWGGEAWQPRNHHWDIDDDDEPIDGTPGRGPQERPQQSDLRAEQRPPPPLKNHSRIGEGRE